MSSCNFFIDNIFSEDKLKKQIKKYSIEDIQKMVDEDLSDENNCTDSNISLIIAQKEKNENNITVNALYISISALIISFLQAIIALCSGNDNKSSIPIWFLTFVLLITAVIIIFMTINAFKGLDQKKSFTFSYLINQMKAKKRGIKMKDRYIFPCIIRFEDNVYYVEFPDIPEAFTDGDDMEEALSNARDVLGLVLYEREENSIKIPEASKDFIKTKDNESISYIDVYMPLYRDMIEQKSVKKTLTIPKWLNDIGMENNLNFSRILQIGIKKSLGIDK